MYRLLVYPEETFLQKFEVDKKSFKENFSWKLTADPKFSYTLLKFHAPFSTHETGLVSTMVQMLTYLHFIVEWIFKKKLNGEKKRLFPQSS